jgi:hypothetical protein
MKRKDTKQKKKESGEPSLQLLLNYFFLVAVIHNLLKVFAVK